jgi:hypothetical protein
MSEIEVSYCHRCGELTSPGVTLCLNCQVYIKQGMPEKIEENWILVNGLPAKTTGSGVCKRCGASLGSSMGFWNPISGLCTKCDPVDSDIDTNQISDGYHTFGELYEHRITLFILLCRFYSDAMWATWEYEGDFDRHPWRSKKHNNGSEFEGWFIMGIGRSKGEQITYHLPLSRWDECDFAKTLELAPEWDGHTSADVLERLKQL